ncbi:MAG TPA: hypothetical protein VK203_28965 [Nostocaceae cyanobacterium]|nr:hypothetical protein [Nostocaceae cyanobacterium]
MSKLELHKHLSNLPDAALQEFTEWCVLEQSKVAGIEFKPDENKLKNLQSEDYLKQLIDQFLKVKPDPIRAGLVAAVAGKQADAHGLTGVAVVADFISLYVKYLIPKDGTAPEKVDTILADATQKQYEQLSQIAQKHGVKL